MKLISTSLQNPDPEAGLPRKLKETSQGWGGWRHSAMKSMENRKTNPGFCPRQNWLLLLRKLGMSFFTGITKQIALSL
jgi:hypothetical protein